MRPANERRRYIYNDVSHWLGASLDLSLLAVVQIHQGQCLMGLTGSVVMEGNY